METTYFFCTINEYLPKLQYQFGQTNWTLSDFLTFLKCLPLNYELEKSQHTQYSEKYYTIHDEEGPVFRVYNISKSIEVIILKVPKVPILTHLEDLSYSQMSLLYKKVSAINFHVDVFKFNYSLNFYMIGGRPDTSSYKISSASFDLLKKLSRLFPRNTEIINEKMLCINSYTHQQQINIYRSVAKDVELLQILFDQFGITRIYMHRYLEGEIKLDESNSINGFLWIAPWAYDAISKFSYIELDCTFSILKPYVTCIPQLIVKNISLPIGFIAGVEESSELYSLLYSELTQVKDYLQRLPVLSDQGPGLIKFCKDYKLTQFFCIRHLINLIGPKSFFGKLVSKLLMSQTEEEFRKNHIYAIKIINGYYQQKKDIPEKVMQYCFLTISDGKIISQPILNTSLFTQRVLYYRGFIAAASNHSEGFHRLLKVISKKNLGIEYNLTKLIEQINKKFEKYISGESAQKLCIRIKNELLEDQIKHKIKPVEECNCNTNHHKEVMLGCKLPCIHTVTENDDISIEYPTLNEENFIKSHDFKPLQSPLTGSLKHYNDNNDDEIDSSNIPYESIEESIIKNRSFLENYEENLITEDAEMIIKNTIIDAIHLGLKKEQIDDFIKFYTMDYILNGCNIELFDSRKEQNLGKYFALNNIK